MKINKRIPAYTLGEILVVIILSSIVLLTCFSILRIIQKQYVSISKNLVVTQDVNLLEKFLWSDLHRFKVTYNKDLDILNCTSQTDSLVYMFEDSFLIRKQDTFRVSIQNKELFLDGFSTQTGVIDAIKITTTPVYGQSNIFVHKEKDASFYMNSDDGI